MSQPIPQPSFDARPLLDPVDPHAVRAFAAELRARPGGSSGNVGTIIGTVIAAVVFVPIFFGMFIAFAMSAASGNTILILPFIVMSVVVVLSAVLLISQWRRRRVTRYRLNRFAQANGMTYQQQIDYPPLPGMIFSLGRSRKSTDIVRGDVPRFVEFGNYQYTVQSGKNSTTYNWGYIAVKLDVPLPNIVLDAKGNNAFGSNLPASFRREQQLSLEGNFNDYFTLYCPAGYERDALYLFTPDIMARFIDNAAELDVEIVDDWLFLYTKRKASTLDPATWAWLFGAVGALITKFDQWARWRDERLLVENPGFTPQAHPGVALPAALPFAPPVGLLAPPPGVAQQGRRLRRSVRWVPIIAVVFVAVLWFVIRIV